MATLHGDTTRPINRIQENVLAAQERRILNWLCARMPGWVTPDMLTGVGMVGALAVFAGYALSNLGGQWLWLSVAGYFVQWFGDSTDGSLARFRKIERPRYGYFLDHSCDGLATTLVVAGIGFSPYVQLPVALIALTGYLLLSIHAFLSVRVLGEMKLSYAYAGPTELRFLLLGLTFSMMGFGREQPAILGLTWLDLLVGGIGIVLIVFFIAQTARVSRRLAVEEPPRNRGN